MGGYAGGGTSASVNGRLSRGSPRAIWWVPANAAAFGLGWLVIWRLDFELYSDAILPQIVNFPLLVIPFGLISGCTLWWILSGEVHVEE